MKIELADLELNKEEKARAAQALNDLSELFESFAARADSLNEDDLGTYMRKFTEWFMATASEPFVFTVGALLNGLRARRELELTYAAQLKKKLETHISRISISKQNPLYDMAIEDELLSALSILEKWEKNAHGFHLEVPSDVDPEKLESSMTSLVAAALREAECHTIIVDFANARIAAGNPPQEDIFFHTFTRTFDELLNVRQQKDELRKEAARNRVRAKTKKPR